MRKRLSGLLGPKSDALRKRALFLEGSPNWLDLKKAVRKASCPQFFRSSVINSIHPCSSRKSRRCSVNFFDGSSLVHELRRPDLTVISADGTVAVQTRNLGSPSKEEEASEKPIAALEGNSEGALAFLLLRVKRDCCILLTPSSRKLLRLLYDLFAYPHHLLHQLHPTVQFSSDGGRLFIRVVQLKNERVNTE